MKKRLILVSAVVSMLLTGCNQATPQPVERVVECNSIMQGPSWIRKGGIIENGLGVVGSSSKKLSTSFKMDIAQADAYTKAGNQLKTDIVGTLEFLRDSHNDLEKETMDKVFALDVKNIPLSGLKVKDMWSSSCNDDFFVWMVMDIDSEIANTKKVLQKVNAQDRVIKTAVEVLNKKVEKLRSR